MSLSISCWALLIFSLVSKTSYSAGSADFLLTFSNLTPMGSKAGSDSSSVLAANFFYFFLFFYMASSTCSWALSLAFWVSRSASFLITDASLSAFLAFLLALSTFSSASSPASSIFLVYSLTFSNFSEIGTGLPSSGTSPASFCKFFKVWSTWLAAFSRSFSAWILSSLASNFFLEESMSAFFFVSSDSFFAFSTF